jgi:hypothetical protein
MQDIDAIVFFHCAGAVKPWNNWCLHASRNLMKTQASICQFQVVRGIPCGEIMAQQVTGNNNRTGHLAVRLQFQ